MIISANFRILCKSQQNIDFDLEKNPNTIIIYVVERQFKTKLIKAGIVSCFNVPQTPDKTLLILFHHKQANSTVHILQYYSINLVPVITGLLKALDLALSLHSLSFPLSQCPHSLSLFLSHLQGNMRLLWESLHGNLFFQMLMFGRDCLRSQQTVFP